MTSLSHKACSMIYATDKDVDIGPSAVGLPNSTAQLINYLLHNTSTSAHPPALPLDPMVAIHLPSIVL